MSVVGFDFGTTNSLISLVRGRAAIHFFDDESRPIPSVVCYEGQQTIVGRAARERLSHAGLGVQGNTVRSPKVLLGRDSVFLEGIERKPVDIVADVVRHVVEQARGSGRGRELSDLTGAVVTIPVNMDGARRRALRDAFRLAGVRIVQFVHEPLAALYGHFRSQGLETLLRRYDRKLLLVFDWGGGTLDLTLCRPIDNQLVQIRNDGTDEVGGDVFDETLLNGLLQRLCAQRGICEPQEQLGARARLLDACERAKISLSGRARAQVYVPSYFRAISDEDFDYSLSQEELEGIVAPVLDKGFDRIRRLLDDARFAQEQVALCLATGGMSNMPVVQRRLLEWFGPGRVEIPDGTATMIAEGAAWIAADRAGLQLAKTVELVLARNSYFPLYKAGTRMPREGEVQEQPFDLYCTDPRDGIAKFQICAPKRAGRDVPDGDERTHLGNLTVRVDSQVRPFHERLRLDVRVDPDLVLEVRARSLNVADEDRCEIHNLEFGLAFPTSESNHDRSAPEADESSPVESPPPGSVSVRSNVADHVNLRLVPGELLFTYDPHYFDTRGRASAVQNFERLYYEPCALCGRRSNDPMCRCDEPSADKRPTVVTPTAPHRGGA